MNVFLMIVKITLLIAVLFMGVGSIGVTEDKVGERCVMLTGIFTAALVALFIFCD